MENDDNNNRGQVYFADVYAESNIILDRVKSLTYIDTETVTVPGHIFQNLVFLDFSLSHRSDLHIVCFVDRHSL